MKRKTLSLTLCLLTCLALIGVGFAAWVITYSDTDSKTGNINVETVETNEYDFVILTESAPSFDFTKPAHPDTFANPWLTSTSSTTEVLSVSFDVKVVNKSATESTKGIQLSFPTYLPEADKPEVTVSFKVADAYTSKWTAVTGANLLKNFEIAVDEKAPAADDDYVYTITISTDWGTALNGQNPYNYYNAKDMTASNGKEPSATFAKEAETNMKLIAELLSATYTLTLAI